MSAWLAVAAAALSVGIRAAAVTDSFHIDFINKQS